MKLNELIKRIIDTANFNEMAIDTEMAIEYACQIVEPLYARNVKEVTDSIIIPLMDQYRDANDNEEMEFIQGTIILINDYLLQPTA